MVIGLNEDELELYEMLLADDLETFLANIRNLVCLYSDVHGYKLSDVVEVLNFVRDADTVMAGESEEMTS